jgi:hypothetical protein
MIQYAESMADQPFPVLKKTGMLEAITGLTGEEK